MKGLTHSLSVPATVLATALFSPVLASAQVLSAPCLDNSRPLAVEEARLPNTLPDNTDFTKLQSTSFAQQMIEGGGFQDFGPQVVRQLCSANSLDSAEKIAMQNGQQLWRMAVNRAQQRGPVAGSLPYSDDRPLYWTRLQVRAALRQWVPSFGLNDGDRAALITMFDRAGRGMFDIKFPAGKGVKRIIMSGFDPYTLDGQSPRLPSGQVLPPGAVGNNIRHGNPSGATALSIDGTVYYRPDGVAVFIEAYTLPVNYPEFEAGYLEDTVGPFMQQGPRQVDASVTVSQAGDSVFNLEMWNGRYHGVSLGNDNFAPCRSVPNPNPPPSTLPQIAVNNHECDIMVVERWGGPPQFELFDPPQWTTGSLPFPGMIRANTGAGIPRPPGDEWPDTSIAFGVVWHTNYTEFTNCNDATSRLTRNSPVPSDYPPPTKPIPPDAGSCSYSGGGGNYLSNESAFRNTHLRDTMGLSIPAGHIHTPDMNSGRFLNPDGTTDYFSPTDASFNAWRLAITQQARNLIHAVADCLGAGPTSGCFLPPDAVASP